MNGYTHVEEIPRGRYGLIMADPPWSFKTWSQAGKGKSPDMHYNCTPLEWIQNLPVGELAAPNCILWLWGINPMLPEAIDTLVAWGFEFKTAGHWSKKTKHGKQAFGTGYILRGAGEPFLIGTKGKPKTSRSVRSVIEAKVRDHSRKPEEAYAAAEKLYPDVERLEFFSRCRRPGWDVFGNEIDKFDVDAA